MIGRCTNKKNKAWPDYGGRGIRVCDRWRGSFENFLADVGKRPSGSKGKVPEFSLDRIDNDSHYEPGNVRWATREVQVNNRRGADIVRMSVQIACQKRNLPYNVFVSRIKQGWDVVAALTMAP